ncbi:hypothetical protein P3X46_030446 [Hevea brasiliensis]|uniref:Uncharacterized protein n=1 Tax=Hevea brasiliensis TaxID=3981 RepID=A0ABQ9KK82_HEVBR|nr:hypothetical protein P3X46_030446 [Hevea brasiliensis]
MCYDTPEPTFYDDTNFSCSIENSMKDWVAKRREWLKRHPTFAATASDRIFLVTGSQPQACKNPVVDHVLLRLFKNKVDYCRIHGYEIFYNNVLLHPKMKGFWAKYPIVEAAMLARPEAEWIWWVDSDAVFTEMEFKLPLEKYKDYNLVVNGWSSLVYKKRSWTSVNAGVFLIRNCQWSMDFMNAWIRMGLQTPNYEMWGKIQRSIFKYKMFPEADDQAGLIHLLLKEKEKWGGKIYLEEEYWLDVVDAYENITQKYLKIQKEVPSLRRRHAEKSSFKRRPLITQFTGCEPCSGDHSPAYSWEACFNGMRRALNLADNQVLLNYGFLHQNHLDSSSVSALLIDLPS